MEYSRIIKEPIEHHSARPNLRDYRKMFEEVTWDKVSRDLDWFDSEHINISHVAIDSHLKTDRRDKKALIWESQRGEIEEYTFSDMARLSNKFANVLVKELGVQKGDRVFFFLERVPEIYIGILGTLKAGGVIGPLFSAFGPDAVKDRLEDSKGKVFQRLPNHVEVPVSVALPCFPGRSGTVQRDLNNLSQFPQEYEKSVKVFWKPGETEGEVNRAIEKYMSKLNTWDEPDEVFILEGKRKYVKNCHLWYSKPLGLEIEA